MTRADLNSLVDDAFAAQLGVFAFARKSQRLCSAPPISPERAREALARQAQWWRPHAAERVFGWPMPLRDVGAELTEDERRALWAFFDRDPRRLGITDMVEICARGEALDR